GDVERVLVRVFASYASAVLALEHGEADVIDYLRPDDAVRLARSERLVMLRLPAFSYAVLQFNLLSRPATAGGRESSAPGSRAGRRRHPVFGDPRVRRALAMGI